ncbi:glutathione S-transferase N-terminal domain-containing protein [Methylocella tundrae]|uniref:glutathione S-transferase N-terminal domain-containing protein n=1 Tax=Methylocella tundrae TaxID=227605 RepID=UPI003BF8E5C3
MAEKGMSVPTAQVDLAAGEQFSEAYRAINPRCAVPSLVLDNGVAICEVLAICRYIEEIQPEPRLLGSSPEDKAIVTMWERRMEIDGFFAVAEAVRNSFPGLRGRALVGPHTYEQIPALADRGRQRTLDFFRDLDARLADAPFVAGKSFSIADITAMVTIDFAASRIKLVVPDEYKALKRWRDAVSARPSMKA